MKKLVILLIAMLLFIAGCSTGTPTDKPNASSSAIEHKETSYDFTLKDLEGQTYTLSEQSGKNVYLKFWASWCPVCLSGLNDLNDLAGEDNDFEVVTIVSPGYQGEKSKDDFLTWFNGLDYPNIRVLLDEDGEVFDHYGVKALPTNAIIDRFGNTVKIIPGEIKKETISNLFQAIETEE